MSINNRFRDILGKVSKATPVKNQQTVLDVLVKRICQSFETLVPGIFDRLLNSLDGQTGSSGKNQKLREVSQALSIYTLLHEHKTDFQKKLKQRFEANFTQALDNLAAAESFLPLVLPDEIDGMFLIRNLSTKLQIQYHDFLSELSTLLATVAGVEEISSAANPMRPALVVDSVYEAWQSLKADHDSVSDVLFLQKITFEVMGDLRPMYVDAIKTLTDLNIQPTQPTPLGQEPAGIDSSQGAGQVSSSVTQETAAPVSFFHRLQTLASQMLPDSDAAGHASTDSSDSQHTSALQLLSQLVSRLPPVTAPHTAPPALRPMAAEAMSGLVHADVKTDVLSALDYLQSAQLHQPEKFREALSPDASQLADMEGESAEYLDPVSPAHLSSGGAVKFVNVVRSIQQSEIGQKTNALNASVIELVARVFDFVFQDKSLPDIIKLLLSRLQIPLLKAALLDVSFFEQSDHPARRLVNTLASAALGWQETDGQESPLFVLIENTINRVVADFKDDLSLFETLSDELSAFVKRQEDEAQRQTGAEREQAQQAATETENEELANRAARQVIEERLNDRRTTPFVSNFLREAWVKYVCHLLLNAQNDTTQLSNAVVTADDLLWSIEPKCDRLERVRMLAKLPAIESQIRTATALIAWPDEYSNAFFRNLDDRWAGAVIGEPILAPGTTTATDSAPHSIDDALVEEEDSAMTLVTQLEPGDMVELIKDDGAHFCYKVGWMSEAKTRFLLTNRLNSAPLIVTAKHLAQQYGAGKMRVMEREPLMDRALSNMLDALEETRYPEEMMHQTGTY